MSLPMWQFQVKPISIYQNTIKITFICSIEQISGITWCLIKESHKKNLCWCVLHIFSHISGHCVWYFLKTGSKGILITGRWRSLLPLWDTPLPICSQVTCFLCLSIRPPPHCDCPDSSDSGLVKAGPPLTVTPEGGTDASFLNESNPDLTHHPREERLWRREVKEFVFAWIQAKINGKEALRSMHL